MSMPIKIIGLAVDNVMGVRTVHLEPTTVVRGEPLGDLSSRVLKIAGANRQGKTSFLEALSEVLAGRGVKAFPEPIRHGAGFASAEIETDEFIARRTWSEQNGGDLKIRDKRTGKLKGSPAAFLQDLIGRGSFDPMEFASLHGREQRERLLELMKGRLGIDVPLVERQRASLFEARTQIGRERDRLEGELTAFEQPDEDTPTEEYTARGILDELNAAVEANAQHDTAERAHETAKAAYIAAQGEVTRLEAALEEARRTELRRANELQVVARGRSKLAPRVDVEPIRARLDGMERTNRAIRDANEWRRVRAALTEKHQAYTGMTQQIEGLDRRKAEALANAPFPVAGLGFEPEGITYEGVPFRQVNLAQRVTISAAIVMAQNPELRIMQIRDGNALDSSSYAALEQLAAEKEYLVLVEWVDETGQVGVNIREGELAG
jgi:hypothetical protein